MEYFSSRKSNKELVRQILDQYRTAEYNTPGQGGKNSLLRRAKLETLLGFTSSMPAYIFTAAYGIASASDASPEAALTMSLIMTLPLSFIPIIGQYHDRYRHRYTNRTHGLSHADASNDSRQPNQDIYTTTAAFFNRDKLITGAGIIVGALLGTPIGSLIQPAGMIGYLATSLPAITLLSFAGAMQNYLEASTYCKETPIAILRHF